MYEKKIDPNKTLIWHHDKTTAELEELARTGRFDELPPVPVLEIPEKYKHLGEYVLIDGHKRRNAAKKAGIDVNAMIIESGEDIKHITENGGQVYRDRSPKEFAEWIEHHVQDAIEYKSKHS